MRLTHATLCSDVLWLIIHSLVLTHTYNIAFSVSHTHFFSLSSSHISSRSRVVSHSDTSGKPIVILVNPLPQKRLRFAQSFSWQKKINFPSYFKSVYSYKMQPCVCEHTRFRKWKSRSTQRHTRVAICLVLLLVCLSLTAIFWPPSTAPAAGGPGHGARQTGDYGGVECIDRGTWTPPSASHSVYFHLFILLFNTFLLSCHCHFIFWIQFGYMFESTFYN